MFCEIRIDNIVTNDNGDEVSLKRGGAHQQVTIEAEKESAIPASNSNPESLGDY
jgi:hypothetical protein